MCLFVVHEVCSAGFWVNMAIHHGMDRQIYSVWSSTETLTERNTTRARSRILYMAHVSQHLHYQIPARVLVMSSDGGAYGALRTMVNQTTVCAWMRPLCLPAVSLLEQNSFQVNLTVTVMSFPKNSRTLGHLEIMGKGSTIQILWAMAHEWKNYNMLLYGLLQHLLVHFQSFIHLQQITYDSPLVLHSQIYSKDSN